jgi:Spy/CpxP family protein refolding chaperone
MHKAALILVMLLAVAAFAQDSQSQNAPAAPANPPAGHQAHHGMKRTRGIDDRVAAMTRRYKLTDEQQQKLRPILQNEMDQAGAIRNDASLTPEQKKQKLMDLRKQTNAQTQSLLTPEQRAMGRPHRGRNNREMGWLDKKVNLTDDQKTKLKPIFAEQQKQFRSIRQDTSLSPEQKKEKVRDVRQKTHAAVMAVLTPEQQQQLSTARKPNAKAPADSSK